MVEMMSHQEESFEFFCDKERTADFSDPGTGKTLVALSLVVHHEATALVLCPKTLMEVAWVDDAAKFFPHLVVLPSYAPHKLNTFKNDAHIFVVNVDGAKWLAEQKPAFFKKFNMLILDESTSFKHSTSQRSRAVAEIKKYFPIRHIMTGAPMTNGILNIWHQIFLIDDGERLGKSFYGFRNATCEGKQIGNIPQAKRWIERPGALEAVGGLLTDLSIRHEFDKCVDIPKNTTRHIKVELKKQHKVIYEKMKAEALLQYTDGDINAVNAAVLRGKLLQIASGAVYDDLGSYKLMSSDRYELVAALAREREASLIFFLWQHQKNEIIRKLENKTEGVVEYAVIDGTVSSNKVRTQIIRDFESGKYQTLLLHPASAAHGITLVRASATIWPSPTDNLEWWVQAYRRMVRKGQKKKTETILVQAKDTLETHVYQRLLAKRSDMMDLNVILEA